VIIPSQRVVCDAGLVPPVSPSHPLRWVVLPGLGETAEEFGAVRNLLPAEYDVQVLDPWHRPVTAPLPALRAAVGDPLLPIGLVGHSIGGLAALRWALTAPDEVAGLVLVDSSLPSEDGGRWFYPGEAGDRLVRSALHGIGRTALPRLAGPALRDGLLRLTSVSGRDPLHPATVRHRYGSGSAWLRFWDELAASWPLAVEVAELLESRCEHPAPPLPPTIQLVAGGARFARFGQRWLRGQHELSERIGSGLVVLPDAAHLVHLDRPDAIAAAIRETADSVSPPAG
jgi:pimeloyl-ACP methyl ester carboxylesterase